MAVYISKSALKLLLVVKGTEAKSEMAAAAEAAAETASLVCLVFSAAHCQKI